MRPAEEPSITRKWQWVLTGALAITAVVGFWLLYVAQSSSYTPRAKMYEGLGLAAGAKAAVAEHYVTHDRFPDDNAEAGISESISGQFVSDISVLPGGVIQVTYGGWPLYRTRTSRRCVGWPGVTTLGPS